MANIADARKITIEKAIQKKSYKPMYKSNTNNGAKRLGASINVL